MKAKLHSNNKLNNAGFSLVELLIAVAILSIIVIPIMKLFVTSSKFNFRARNSLRTTTIAQDIMEGLRAYNIDEIKDQFKYPNASGPSELETPDPAAPMPTSEFGVVSTGFKLIDKSMVGELGMIESGSCEKYSDYSDLGVYQDTKGNNIGTYYFYLKDIEMQDNGAKYDALIKVDGTRYMEPAATPADAKLHQNDKRVLSYNNDNYEPITGIDAGRDASFEQDPLLNYNVLNAFVNELIDSGEVSDTEVKPVYFSELKANPAYKVANVLREILVKLEDNPAAVAGENNDVIASIGYRYIFVRTDGTEVKKWAIGDQDALFPCGEFSKDGTFFLFYYPSYELCSTFEFDRDAIIIDNQTSFNPLDVYVVQQIDRNSSLAPKKADGSIDNYTIDANIKLHEKNYIHDQSLPAVGGGVLTNLRFYTANIPIAFDANGNLAKKWWYESGCESNVRMYTNLNTPVVPTNKATDTDKLPTDTSDGDFGHPQAAFTGYKEVLSLMRHSLTGVDPVRDVTEIIYDIEVTVYKEGSMDRGFKNDDIVSSITGSMVN